MAGLLERYREVYNRPELADKSNRGALLWDPNGRNADSAGQSAYNAFQEIVGREPTEMELNQFLPTFQNSYEQGRASVANFAQYEAQKPENLAKKAPQYSDQVNSQFKSLLGRDATPEELTHFGGLLASGNADAYQLGDFLKGSSEYQGQQDTKFRGDLSKELENSDVSFFNRAKQGLSAQFMNNGTASSSALDSALADLMGQIADKRSSYLANLSSAQYGGNKDLAIGNYKGSMDQYINDMNLGRSQSYNAFQGNQNRANDIGDYYRQSNDYRQSQQGRNTLHPFDYLNLGLYGANAAANAYGGSKGGGGGGFQPYQQGGTQGPYAYGRY